MWLFLTALIPQNFTFITQQCLSGIRAATSELHPKPKPGIFTPKVHHLIWIRGCMGEAKSLMTGLRFIVVKYLYFTGSLGHRHLSNPHYLSAPLCCNLSGAAHLLLCSTKPKPIPALNYSQSLAGFSEHGWGSSSSSEKPVGWKRGEGGQSQAQLGAGTRSAAWQKMFFYWLIGGVLLNSMLQTHTFLMCRCPLFCADSLAAQAGEDLCWQSHAFSSQKWSRLCRVWGI